MCVCVCVCVCVCLFLFAFLSESTSLCLMPGQLAWSSRCDFLSELQYFFFTHEVKLTKGSVGHWQKLSSLLCKLYFCGSQAVKIFFFFFFFFTLLTFLIG